MTHDCNSPQAFRTSETKTREPIAVPRVCASRSIERLCLRHLLSVTVTALTFAILPAAAQDAGSLPADAPGSLDVSGDRITVAAGGVYLPDYDGANHHRFTAAPAAIGTIKGYSFTLIANRLSVDVIHTRPGPGVHFEIGPVGVINFDRDTLSEIHDPRVRSLGKISDAIELGGYVGIDKTGVITSPYDQLSATVSYRHDVGSVHKSYVVTPSVNYLTPLSRKLAAGVFGSMDLAGRRYAQTYENVSLAQSAVSGLPVYVAHGGLKSYTLGGFATASLTGDLLHGFKIVAGGTYSRELNSFSYSPLTRVAGNPNQFIGALGLAYTF